MKRVVFIMKILSAISFLFIVVPNDKVLIQMWMWLLLGFNLWFIPKLPASLLLIAAVFYLLLSAFKKYTTKRSHILSVISILILYLPVIITFSSVFKYPYLISFFTYGLFLMFSIITLGILLYKIRIE